MIRLMVVCSVLVVAPDVKYGDPGSLLQPNANRRATGRDARVLAATWAVYEKEHVPGVVKENGAIWKAPEMHTGMVAYKPDGVHALVVWTRNQAGLLDDGVVYEVDLATMRVTQAKDQFQ
jgi:hypothetical protein